MYWSADITQFITEHRHKGLDILCLGQVLNDCHAMWKNRVSQKVVFHQRDALGKPGEYTWNVFKGVPGERGTIKFLETTSGKGVYDSRYGCFRLRRRRYQPPT